MRRAILSLLAAAFLGGNALAHGRILHPPGPNPPKPGDAWRPLPRGTGTGSGPAGPAPARPNSPGNTPAGPAGQPGGKGNQPTTPGANEAPLGHWFYWWQMNQGLYLDLSRRWQMPPTTGGDDLELGAGATEAANRSRQPRTEFVRERITPPLVKALETGGNHLTTGALIALAKMGERAMPTQQLVELFLPRLASGSQEVSETAALALGMLESPTAVPALLALLADDELGRELVDGGGVPERTRAFAAFGLGLAGRAHMDVGLRRKILLGLTAALEEGGFSTEEVPVACVSAIGLLPLEARPSPPRAGEALNGDEATLMALLSRRTQVRYLVELLEEPTRVARVERRTRAHLPLAIVRLCAGAPQAVRNHALQALLALLRPRAGTDTELVRGAVLALGVLDRGGDLAPQVIEALLSQLESRDPMTRAFAVLSLAQFRGRHGPLAEDSPEPGLRRLQSLIADPRPTLRPWIALGTGIFLRAHSEIAGAVNDPGDGALAAAALMGATECRAPEEVGAWAVGLGLQRHAKGEASLLERLEHFAGDQPLAYLSTGLGLLGDHAAREALLELLPSAQHRPELLLQASIGLALLGSHDLTPRLTEMLSSTRGSVSQAGVAQALGLTGDARGLQPLLEMLADEEISEPVRAFAAIGLGSACDESPWPWNAPYSIGINYLSATTTLIGDGRGVLEIL